MSPRLRQLAGPAFALCALCALALPAHAAGDPGRGAYLARIMDCAGCHGTTGPDGLRIAGMEFAGGSLGFELPGLGTFWPPNLTPDPTGLAGWTAEEITDAIRAGLRPDGRILAPIMPWANYAGLTDADAADLVAYLRSLPPVANRVPAPAEPGAPRTAPFLAVVVPAE